MRRFSLTRRQFLKLAGLTGLAATPAVLGFTALKTAEGSRPPGWSPYAELPERIWPLGGQTAPILLLINSDAANPFDRYLAEILCAEGLNCFQVARLAEVNPAVLKPFALILLTEGALHASQVDMLQEYVARGGRLIAMRPPSELSGMLGIEREAGNSSDGYWWGDPSHPVGKSFAQGSLQFHGTADHYRLGGAQPVAGLADTPTVPNEPYLAVTVNHYAQGLAAMWAYDLAASVVQMRQGNPAWANQERDNREGVRAQDAFVGWIDLDRIAIPQADEQMRLLSHLIDYMLADILPLPRLWYFPGGANGMLIATGDSHQSSHAAIDAVLLRVEHYGGNMSIYYTPPADNLWRRAIRRAAWSAAELPFALDWVNRADFPLPKHVQNWRQRGHEFSIHPFVENGLEAGWQQYWSEFTGLGYGMAPRTVRTHRILWQGWSETARVQATYGIGLNLDFYHYGPAFQKNTGDWVYGHFTGSGLPMRFVDEQGQILNIYQQLTQLVDEHLIKMPWGIGGSNIGGEAAIEVSRTLLTSSLNGAPAAIAAQFHIDPFALGGEIAAQATRWLEGTLDAAAALDIPIWSAAQWLRFVEIRRAANFELVTWDQGARQLSFGVKAEQAPETELAVMLPARYDEKSLDRVALDGAAVRLQTRSLNGTDYAWFVVPAGAHRVVAAYA